MIESFTIKEEKFINEIYYVNLGVSFNKKKIFNYLEKKNIFPSVPIKKKFLFIPIIIDERKKDLLIFNNNQVYNKWNENLKKTYLIEYILPTEDLEDLDMIKKNYQNIEEYDFKEIISKYNLNHSIITLIFMNDKGMRVLSRITNGNNVILNNQSYSYNDISNTEQVNSLITDLKLIYEDYWKKKNQINTSIKFPLSIKVANNELIKNFENDLTNVDLIYDFYITKFNKNFTYYQIIFNDSPNVFLEIMREKNYNFDTQNRTWSLN